MRIVALLAFLLITLLFLFDEPFSAAVVASAAAAVTGALLVLEKAEERARADHADSRW